MAGFRGHRQVGLFRPFNTPVVFFGRFAGKQRGGTRADRRALGTSSFRRVASPHLCEFAGGSGIETLSGSLRVPDGVRRILWAASDSGTEHESISMELFPSLS